MDLEMVFNELSIDTPATSIWEAQQWMADFIDTIISASAAGINRVFRTHIDINNSLLAPEYPLSRWRNDAHVDLEARRYFRSIVSQYPPLDDLPEISNRMLSQDFFCQGRRAYGLGIAYLLESLAISLPSAKDWDVHEIEVEIEWLNEKEELISQNAQISHASNPSHIALLAGWITERFKTGVENGNDLWIRKEEMFPDLIFCDHVASQILPLQKGSPVFRQIVKRLFELQTYCSAWVKGPFSPDELPFKATVESEPTMQKHRNERTFTCPDGNEITFTWHGRITPGAWRIYFDLCIGPGMMHVGYIGPKLPTVKYET